MGYDDVAARFGITNRQPRQFTQAELNPEFAAMDEMDFGPTDQELFDAQDANTVSSPGGDYQYTPSRESMKTSAMQGLRRQLGMEDIAAQNRALPTRIASEARVHEAAIRGQSAVEVATQNANAVNQRGMLNDTRIRERQAANDKRDHLYGQQQQARAAANTRAGNIRSGREPIANGGMWDGLKATFGMGPSEQDRRNTAADEVMRGVAGTAAPMGGGGMDDEYTDMAQQLMSAYPGKTIGELLQAGAFEYDSPDELQSLSAAWQSIGGQ